MKSNDLEQSDDAIRTGVRVGQQVPDVEFEYFQADMVKRARLSDYQNHWLILFFYPADFTFVCPTELHELAALYPEFRKLDAEVVSVSCDTVFAHKAWHDTSPAVRSVTFPMAADPAGRLAKAFGVLIENASLDRRDDEGLALRGSFVIDPDGVLRAAEVHDNGIGRSAKELLRKLQAAQFVNENGGQVCPAEWQPGAKTYKGDDITKAGTV